MYRYDILKKYYSDIKIINSNICKINNNFYFLLTKNEANNLLKINLKLYIKIKGFSKYWKSDEIAPLIKKNLDKKGIKTLAESFDYYGDKPLEFLEKNESELLYTLMVNTDLLNFEQLIKDIQDNIGYEVHAHLADDYKVKQCGNILMFKTSKSVLNQFESWKRDIKREEYYGY